MERMAVLSLRRCVFARVKCSPQWSNLKMAFPKFIKWLRPGLRIKRWILVILLGMVFAVFATIELYLFATSVQGLDGIGAQLLAAAALGFLLSGFCLITGI